MKQTIIKLLLVLMLAISLVLMNACSLPGGDGTGDGTGEGSGENGGNGGGNGNGGTIDEGDIPDGFFVKLFEAPEELGSLKLSVKDLTLTSSEMSISQTDIAEFVLEIDTATGEMSGGFIAKIAILNGPIEGIAIFDVQGAIDGTDVIFEVAATDSTGAELPDYCMMDKVNLLDVLSSFMGGGGYNEDGYDNGYEYGELEGENVLMSDVVYAESFGYYEEGYDYEEGGMSSVATMIPMILGELAPHIEDLVDANKDFLDDLLEKAINMLFNVRAIAGGYVIEFDTSKLAAVNNDLADLTIEQFVDKYFGEGSFDSIIEALTEVLGLKVSEIPEFLEELGLNTEALFETINGIAATAGATDFDVADVFENDEYANMTIGYLVFAEENYMTYVNDTVAGIRAMTVYGMLTGEEDVSAIKEEIAGVITALNGKISLSVTTDATAQITELAFALNEIDVDGVSVSFGITLELNETMDLEWREDLIERYEEYMSTIM